MTLVETFGRNVRDARQERGWSQEKLALDAGVKRAYLSEVENGHRNASLDIVEKLAAALSMEPGDLMKFRDRT
jgi:transcriptional regulator with XRE-family HTH domain